MAIWQCEYTWHCIVVRSRWSTRPETSVMFTQAYCVMHRGMSRGYSARLIVHLFRIWASTMWTSDWARNYNMNWNRCLLIIETTCNHDYATVSSHHWQLLHWIVACIRTSEKCCPLLCIFFIRLTSHCCRKYLFAISATQSYCIIMSTLNRCW